MFDAEEGSAVYFQGVEKEVFGIFKATKTSLEIGSCRDRVEGPNLGLMTAASLKELLPPPGVEFRELYLCCRSLEPRVPERVLGEEKNI
jgi:hypothetical protein